MILSFCELILGKSQIGMASTGAQMKKKPAIIMIINEANSVMY